MNMSERSLPKHASTRRYRPLPWQPNSSEQLVKTLRDDLLAELDSPPPRAEGERHASEDLLRRVDEAVENLRREAHGLQNAREQYRRRLEGTRGER